MSIGRRSKNTGRPRSTASASGLCATIRRIPSGPAIRDRRSYFPPKSRRPNGPRKTKRKGPRLAAAIRRRSSSLPPARIRFARGPQKTKRFRKPLHATRRAPLISRNADRATQDQERLVSKAGRATVHHRLLRGRSLSTDFPLDGILEQ